MKISYTIDEACAICSIGRTKLYESISSGKIKAKKLGKRTLILKDDLERFIESLEDYSTQE